MFFSHRISRGRRAVPLPCSKELRPFWSRRVRYVLLLHTYLWKLAKSADRLHTLLLAIIYNVQHLSFHILPIPT